jgi:hypothetical protein
MGTVPYRYTSGGKYTEGNLPWGGGVTLGKQTKKLKSKLFFLGGGGNVFFNSTYSMATRERCVKQADGHELEALTKRIENKIRFFCALAASTSF